MGETDGISYLVRSFLPGMSLLDYAETECGQPGLTREASLQVLLSTLRLLSFLHHLDPPIIHRDIKPENIIVRETKEGMNVSLIDLGIARLHQEGGSKNQDTQAMGTFYFAPPEQFGYQETDERSDIYAAGVLLRYCLTQDYEPTADEHISPDLRRVIQKATQFDPRNRYQKDEQMIRALEELFTPKAPRKKKTILSGLLCMALVVLLGFFFARPSQMTAYQFKEPLLEAAVRAFLQKPEGDLTLEDLKEVTSIHIFGKQLYSREDEFLFQAEYVIPINTTLRDSGLWEENGGIESLSDLKALPLLKELCLYRQNISSLEGVDLDQITYLGIGYNPISDLSPLDGCESLKGLNISCLKGISLDPVETLPNLEELVIAGFEELDLRDFASLPLVSINIMSSWFKDDEVLLSIPSLRKITLSKLYPGLVYLLSQMEITDLLAVNAEEITLRDLETIPTLENLTYRVNPNFGREYLGREPLRFPNMKELILKEVTIESLESLSELTHLQTLGIYDCDCLSYEGLSSLTELRLIYATPEQQEALRQAYPEESQHWTMM